MRETCHKQIENSPRTRISERLYEIKSEQRSGNRKNMEKCEHTKMQKGWTMATEAVRKTKDDDQNLPTLRIQQTLIDKTSAQKVVAEWKKIEANVSTMKRSQNGVIIFSTTILSYNILQSYLCIYNNSHHLHPIQGVLQDFPNITVP